MVRFACSSFNTMNKGHFGSEEARIDANSSTQTKKERLLFLWLDSTHITAILALFLSCETTCCFPFLYFYFFIYFFSSRSSSPLWSFVLSLALFLLFFLFTYLSLYRPSGSVVAMLHFQNLSNLQSLQFSRSRRVKSIQRDVPTTTYNLKSNINVM